jgi:hypothetical protein
VASRRKLLPFRAYEASDSMALGNSESAKNLEILTTPKAGMASPLDSITTVVAMLEANTINGGSIAVTTELVKSP